MDDAESVSRSVKDALLQLSQDIRDYDISSQINRIQHRISSLDFLRDYVSSNKPVVIDNGCVSHWNALESWSSDEYLCTAVGENNLVTVALTPNGRADCPTVIQSSSSSPEDNEMCFALPYQHKMKLKDFFTLLNHSKMQQQSSPSSSPTIIPYLQFQNDSLRTELPCLLSDIDDSSIQWAFDALGGCSLDAVNIWIGSNKSITSWHKDHYENIYVVIRGRKTFKLLPPADVFRMKMKKYPIATYQLVDSSSSDSVNDDGNNNSDDDDTLFKKQQQQLVPVIHSPREEITWSSILPIPIPNTLSTTTNNTNNIDNHNHNSNTNNIDNNNNNNNSNNNIDNNNNNTNNIDNHNDTQIDDDVINPIYVTLDPGQILYLPSCWWHEVHNTADDNETTIAVNYWFDMKFDNRYAYYSLVERLASTVLEMNESSSSSS